MSDPTPRDLPRRVVVGKNGAYWRDFGTHYSMCPVSEDNDPVEPVAVYVRSRRTEVEEWARDAALSTTTPLAPKEEADLRDLMRHADGFGDEQWILALLATLDAERAALSTTPAPLDAAWAAAEAALPEGWRLRVTRSDPDFVVWEASGVSPAFFEGENDNDAECAIGEADSPAAALLALAEKLRESQP